MSGRARLGELAGDAADLHHRLRAGEGQHDRHLQEDAEEVADVVGAMLGKALGAVAALQQEGLAGRDLGELLLQLARLTCKNQRRKGRETGLGFTAARRRPDRTAPAGSACFSRNSGTISSLSHPTVSLALARSRSCRSGSGPYIGTHPPILPVSREQDEAHAALSRRHYTIARSGPKRAAMQLFTD